MLKTPVKKFTPILFALFLTTTVFSIESVCQHNTTQYKNIAKGRPYTFNITPNYAFCSDPGDNVQLTDGIYTFGKFWAMKTTVGWQKKRPIIITIDLGKIEPIRGLSYNTAAGIAGVTWPVSVHILVSDDGANYFSIGDLITLSNRRKPTVISGYAVHRYWIDSLRTHGRYVQLIIDSGGPYCFTDEIEIYRGDDSWITMRPINESTRGGIEFFQFNSTNNSIKYRLYADLREARRDIEKSGLGGKETNSLFAELDDIELAIPTIRPVDPKSFVTIFPINDLQKRIFSVRSKMRHLKGLPPIEVWVSHPLDPIKPTQISNSGSRRKLEVIMMRGEWRPAVFNLTNSLPKPINIQFSINGLPGGNNPDYVFVYEVQWTDTAELKPIAAALKEIRCSNLYYSTIIPGGMTRQIWLSFHPVNVVPGNHTGQIIVKEPDGKRHEIPLHLRLFPMKFPDKPKLHVGGWDYTDADTMGGVTAQNRDKFITHLQERFADSPWATWRVMPFGSFNLAGDFAQKPNTARFDTWISRWPNARRYCVFLNVGTSLAGSKMGSEAFSVKVKSWIDFWVSHASAKGIKPEQLFLLLLDEPKRREHDLIITAWSKAIRAAQPKVNLWEDPTYLKPERALPEMMASVNVLSPNRTQLLSEGNHFKTFYLKQKAEGRRLDLYSSDGPMHLLDPYAYVRLQAWSCWDMGAESTLFWSFSDAGGGNSWNPYMASRMNYAPMFIAPDSVTPGKHMEALRESVEDFEYFVMLQSAIAKAKQGNPKYAKAKELLHFGARRVLDAKNANKLNWCDDKDRWLAEAVRLEILEIIMALKD